MWGPAGRSRAPGSPDPLARAIGLVSLAAFAVAAAIIAFGPPPEATSDPLVERVSYGAGWRHAVDHQRDPRPSGLPAEPDGTRTACQLWIDQQPRGALDRDDFLAGCADAASPPVRP